MDAYMIAVIVFPKFPAVLEYPVVIEIARVIVGLK